jgi:hypothetical protein
MAAYSTLDNPRFCTFEGCGRKHYGSDLCAGHYQQAKRGVELKPLIAPKSTGPRKQTLPCSFDPCDKPSRTGGLCSGHHNQQSRGQELRPLRPRRANGTVVGCSFSGCTNTTTGGAFGLCRGHYRQQQLGRNLEPLPDRNDNLARDGKGRKCCATCREWLAVDDFQLDAYRPDGLQSRCKTCLRTAMLATTYGVTVDQYNEMLAEQGGGCAICGVSESPDGSSLAVDHDHACCPGRKSCGQCVRGLLCRPCNQGLGNFLDRPELLAGAAEYLLKRD